MHLLGYVNICLINHLLVHQVIRTPSPVQVAARPPIHYVYQKRKKEINVAIPDGDPPISTSSSYLETHTK